MARPSEAAKTRAIAVLHRARGYSVSLAYFPGVKTDSGDHWRVFPEVRIYGADGTAGFDFDSVQSALKLLGHLDGALRAVGYTVDLTELKIAIFADFEH